MKNIIITSYIAAIMFSGTLLAQTTTQTKLATTNAPFNLTDLEATKLENFKLKADILQNNIQQATQQLRQQLNEFTQQVIKNHGSPSNVIFDSSKFEFITIPQSNNTKPAEKK